MSYMYLVSLTYLVKPCLTWPNLGLSEKIHCISSSHVVLPSPALTSAVPLCNIWFQFVWLEATLSYLWLVLTCITWSQCVFLVLVCPSRSYLFFFYFVPIFKFLSHFVWPYLILSNFSNFVVPVILSIVSYRHFGLFSSVSRREKFNWMERTILIPPSNSFNTKYILIFFIFNVW